MKKNLNTQKGSYAYELTNNIQKIYELYGNPSINASVFKAEIIKLTTPAADTSAKRNFLNVLVSKRTKDDIVMYISNITLRAEHLSADINDKWANEK